MANMQQRLLNVALCYCKVKPSYMFNNNDLLCKDFLRLVTFLESLMPRKQNKLALCMQVVGKLLENLIFKKNANPLKGRHWLKQPRNYQIALQSLCKVTSQIYMLSSFFTYCVSSFYGLKEVSPEETIMVVILQFDAPEELHELHGMFSILDNLKKVSSLYQNSCELQ